MSKANQWIKESKMNLGNQALSGEFCHKKSCVKGPYCNLVEMEDESGFAILKPNSTTPLEYRFLDVSPLSHNNHARKNHVLMVKLADKEHTYKAYCKNKKHGGEWRVFNTKTGVVMNEIFSKIYAFPLQYKKDLIEANKTFSYFGNNFCALKEYTINQYDKIYTRVVGGINCFFVELADKSGYTLFNAETCNLSSARFAGVEIPNKGVVPYIFPVPAKTGQNKWTFTTPLGAIANLRLSQKTIETTKFNLFELLPTNPKETARITRGVKHNKGAYESLGYADAIIENYKETCADCSTVNDGILKQQLQANIFSQNCEDKKFLNDYRIKNERTSNQELTNLKKALTTMSQLSK